MDVKESDILGENVGRHWYYRSKAKAVMRLLSHVSPSVILDIGAGSGFFTKKLLSETTATESWCVDTSYRTEFDTTYNEKPLYFRQSIDKVNADLILLIDVLEHIDDDIGFLKSYSAKVPSGATFLISVPAFQFLWSGHDVFLEHKRRYRLNQIEGVIRQAGLEIKLGVYYFGAVLPIAIALRMANNFLQSGQYVARSQLSQHHPLINEALSALSSAELQCFQYNRVAGLTIFVLAERL
jgi:hypothetical protein